MSKKTTKVPEKLYAAYDAENGVFVTDYEGESLENLKVLVEEYLLNLEDDGNSIEDTASGIIIYQMTDLNVSSERTFFIK